MKMFNNYVSGNNNNNNHNSKSDTIKNIALKSFIFLVIVILLKSCGFANDDKEGEERNETQAPAATQEVTEPTQEATQGNQVNSEVQNNSQDYVLKFVDAHGVDYETTIDSSLKMHSYDFSKLTDNNGLYGYSDSNGVTAKLGIDVSKYQGDIDWNKVKAAGIEYVIVRIGFRGYGAEGTLNLDTKFAENVAGATQAGLGVGVYFYSQAKTNDEAAAEADFVIQNLAGYNLTYPVVYDVEVTDGARVEGVTKEQFTSGCITFCDKIKNAGFTPMIYTNMVWEALSFDMKTLQDSGYDIWYADYEKTPQTPYDFKMWQYTEKGKIDGINSVVDIDLWFE